MKKICLLLLELIKPRTVLNFDILDLAQMFFAKPT